MEEQKTYEVATHSMAMPEDSPAALMIKAMAGGMDLEKLEKFMLLQEKYEANQARKAYTAAMSNFKKNPPDIEKDTHVEYRTDKGITKYNHASLGNVTAKINAALGEHGLSAAWTTDQSEKDVTVTCKITHVLGHFETTSLKAAPDNSGGKNAIQALGSTIAYLERYTVLALTGLATREMDDDATGPAEVITDAQAQEILELIEKKNVDAGKFLVYMGVNTIGEIISTDFDKAMTALRAAKGKKVQDAPINP